MSDSGLNLWGSARLADLRRFVAVVETGGFSSAARQLGETAKQLSRRIALLEDAAGVVLFQRTTRTVRPTLEGMRLYEAVREALNALELGLDDVTQEGVRGRVRVQIPTLMVESFVDWMAEALWIHPDLEVDLIVADRVGDLVAEGLDLAITGAPGGSTTVLRRRLVAVAPSLWASPRYLERRGVPRLESDLAHHECLRFAGREMQTAWPMMRDGGITLVPVGGRLACGDSRALLRALHGGLGIGPMVPGPVSGDLVRVLPEWTMAPMELFALVAPGRQRLRRVRLVLDAVSELAASLAM